MVLGYILVLLSAFGFGVMPIFALYAYEANMGVPTLLFLRFAFSTLLFFSYIFLRVKGWRVSAKQLLSLFILGGVLYTLQATTYFNAVRFIPASLAALLLYLYPVFVAILSFFVNKERLTTRIVVSIAISLGGIALVLGTPSGEISIVGVLLAVAAAIIYSVYILLGDRVTANLPPVVTSGFVTLFALVSFSVYGVSTNSLDFTFAPMAWLYVLGVALFSTVLSIFTFFAGMRLIGPTKASIMSMVEPVVTTVFSVLLLSDRITPLQIIGGSIVIIGAALVFLAREKKKVLIEEYNSSSN